MFYVLFSTRKNARSVGTRTNVSNITLIFMTTKSTTVIANIYVASAFRLSTLGMAMCSSFQMINTHLIYFQIYFNFAAFPIFRCLMNTFLGWIVSLRVCFNKESFFKIKYITINNKMKRSTKSIYLCFRCFQSDKLNTFIESVVTHQLWHIKKSTICTSDFPNMLKKTVNCIYPSLNISI